eukprot:g5867.t1
MSSKSTTKASKKRKKGIHVDTRTGLELTRPEKMTCVMCGRLGHLTPKNRKCTRTYREQWLKLSESERLERIRTHQRAYIEQCKKKPKIITLPSTNVFKNKIFSLSLNGETSRDDLISKITLSGGKITGQIHKNVHALVCSSSALDCNTQRVRKARKRNVPIVPISYIDFCISENKHVPPHDYNIKKKS